MASDTLTRVRYAGSDFSTYSDEILARLQVKFASVYNDFSASSLGIMLVDIFAYGLDTLSFYLDRRATDNFMITARTTSSAARLARQLGYRPGSASAASVDLSISLNAVYAFPVTIPVGFQFNGPNGLIFEAQSSITFSPGDTSTQVLTAAQGQTLTASFFSDASANQVFNIANVPSGQFVVGIGTAGQSKTSVVVNSTTWEEEPFLQLGGTNQFEIGYVDSPPTLRFGDGIAGNIPDNGAQIALTYFASNGVNGGATAGTITSVKSPLVVSFTQINLNVTNLSGTSGGSAPESLSSIKANAPAIFKTRNVNVTLEDYQSRAQAFVDPVYGAIAVAEAISVRSASDDAFLTSTLNSINSQSAEYTPTVIASVDEISINLTSINASVTDAQSNGSSLQSALTDMLSEEITARASNETNRTAANVAQSNSLSVATDIASMTAAINAFTDGTTQISTTDKSTLIGFLNAMSAKNTEIGSQASTITSNVTSVTSALDQISADITTAESTSAEILLDISSISSQSSLIKSESTALVVAVEAIQNTISTSTAAIETHVGNFLSDECQSNLIEVPVLTLDSEGFYVLPTLGLQNSLQTYLDNGKEVTQVVKVVAASSQLVAADMSMLIGVLTGYNESTVRSQCQAAALNVLRGRAFGVTLRLSELYAPVAPQFGNIPIAGVEYVEIKITGPADHIDANGNLTASSSEVITRGTITVTSEVVSKSLVGQ